MAYHTGHETNHKELSPSIKYGECTLSCTIRPSLNTKHKIQITSLVDFTCKAWPGSFAMPLANALEGSALNERLGDKSVTKAISAMASNAISDTKKGNSSYEAP